ncbi:hypothetical protein SeMB42_g05323 [Synchytrium endobioticum]|uniref:Deleted in lung and esophageal cancer protein 1 Ig-like domain-containing protein n=1 Tax=Synchytrium endobioticum TaxID=286115 RepID=A0A507CS67_9FUNG|nr:hypothetical protein SeMB42_g05323 [Synchytrium endobioticum]
MDSSSMSSPRPTSSDVANVPPNTAASASALAAVRATSPTMRTSKSTSSPSHKKAASSKSSKHACKSDKKKLPSSVDELEKPTQPLPAAQIPLESHLVPIDALSLTNLVQSMLANATELKRILATEHERTLKLRDAELAKAKKQARRKISSWGRDSTPQTPPPAELLNLDNENVDSRSSMSSTKASVIRNSLIARPQDLDIFALPPLAAETLQTRNATRVEAILKQRDEKVTDIRRLKDDILDAWKRTYEEEENRLSAGVAAFGQGFIQLELPAEHVLIHIDNEVIRQKSLIPFIQVNDISDHTSENTSQPQRQSSQSNVPEGLMPSPSGRGPHALGRKPRQVASVRPPRPHKSVASYLQNYRLQETPPSIAPSADVLSDLASNYSCETKDNHPCVSADPWRVLFSEYEAGDSYSQVVLFRNIGRRPVRIRANLVPKNVFFIVEPLQTPGVALGLIAPGMSVSYRITFLPRSLADSEANLVVTSEGSSQTLIVPLMARRTRPSLTLPDSLMCGPCRAGLTVTRQWQYENTGGSGKFVMLGPGDNVGTVEMEWTKDVGGSTIAGPFEISPRRFSLNPGQSGVITIKYRPTFLDDSKTEHQDMALIKLACDNGNILMLPVTGLVESAKVAVVRIVDIRGTKLKHPLLDSHGYHATWFGKQNVGAETSRLVTVENKTRLRLPFQWHIHDEFTKIDQARAPFNNGETPFYIYPTEGILHPESEATFDCKFAPVSLGECEGFAQMMLPRSDRSQPDVALGLRCAGDSWECTLRVYNDSCSEASFEFHVENIDPNMLQVVVPDIDGFVQAGTSLPICIQLLGRFPGVANGRLLCRIADKRGPVLSIPIRARIDFPPGQVEFQETDCDYGLMALGGSLTKRVALMNNSDERVYFDAFISDTSGTFSVSPSEGWMEAHQEVAFYIQCSPKGAGKITEILETKLMSEFGISTEGPTIRLSTTCTPPAVLIEGDQKVYNQCFFEVEHSTPIRVRNTSPLPATVDWDEYRSDIAYVYASPKSIIVPPFDTAQISINSTFYKTGEIDTVTINGTVEGALEPDRRVSFGIEAYVSGICIDVALEVEQGVPPSTLRQLEIKYDSSLFETKTQTLIIRNTSPIRSEFKINVDQYKAPSESDMPSNDSHGDRSALLSISAKEGPSFTSQAGQAYLRRAKGTREIVARARKVLQAGRGAAFKITPATGIIEPHQELKVEIQAFNNLIGSYEDLLMIEIGNWIHMSMPIFLTVSGCPVIMSGPHLAARTTDEIDWLPFGTMPVLPNKHTVEDGCTRSLTLENVCPRDVVITWSNVSSPLSMDTNPIHVPPFRPVKLSLRFASEKVESFDRLLEGAIQYIQPNGTRASWPHPNNTRNLGSETCMKLRVTGKATQPVLSLESGGEDDRHLPK